MILYGSQAWASGTGVETNDLCLQVFETGCHILLLYDSQRMLYSDVISNSLEDHKNELIIKT